MFYRTEEGKGGLPFDPLKALVSPRPIGWISSLSKAGKANLAPYSFFNLVSTRPPYVMFSSTGYKDSIANIEATGEFVCNIVGEAQRDQMVATSEAVAAEVDEFELAGLEKAPSETVKPPRVAGAPAALECRFYQTIDLPADPKLSFHSTLVLGLITGVFIDDSLLIDGRVDAARYKPIARAGYKDYVTVHSVYPIDEPR